MYPRIELNIYLYIQITWIVDLSIMYILFQLNQIIGAKNKAHMVSMIKVQKGKRRT